MLLVDASDAVAPAWALFRVRMLRVAQRLTRDRDLRDDLVQEALITLWERDPTRFDLRDSEERGYLFRTMANRMRDVCRAETVRRPKRRVVFPTLDAGKSIRQLRPALEFTISRRRPIAVSAGGL